MDSHQTHFQPQQSWSWGDNGNPETASTTGIDLNSYATATASRVAVEVGPRARATYGPKPATVEDELPSPSATEPEPQPQPEPQRQPQPQQQRQQRRRHYRPRTCRICLDTVRPTFDVPTGGDGVVGGAASALFGAASASQPRVRYVSEDPELGRLISPCKCKGSQRYVHEGCLQAWRQAAPLSDRNFWSCPTCKFRYRMDRLRWASWLSSRLTRAALTLLVLVTVVFVLGFVADPIINLWVDPIGAVADAVSGVIDDVNEELGSFEAEPFTWTAHFLKGLVSLGLLGCVKAVLAMSPWQLWHIRSGGMLGGGGGNRRGHGRDRYEGINLALVIIGIFTFLAAVWKGISYLSATLLEKVSDRVLDVQGDDDEDDEEELKDEEEDDEDGS